MNKLGETNSDEWDKIKGWLGAANGKKDHPLVQEARRAQRVQKFDDGSGDVEPDADIQKLLQPQGAGLIAPSAFKPPVAQPAPVQAPMAPQRAPIQPPAQMPTQTPAPAVPAPQGPDSGSQVNQILGTSPQELEQFLQKVNQPNWRQQIGAGVTGLADAFSRAGGSNSDYEKQYGERVQQGKENMSAIPGKVAELGKEKFGLSQTLDAQNPSSPYSKTNQATYGPDLIKMGLTLQQVSKMPASLIGDLLGKKITLEEAKARIEETGAYQQGMLANTAQNQKAQIQQGAARDLENRSLPQKVKDFFSKSPETETLERQAGGGGAIPDGRVTVVSPDGQVGHIPQSQLRAALSKGYKQQ